MHKLITTLLFLFFCGALLAQSDHRAGEVLVQLTDNQRDKISGAAKQISAQRNIWLVRFDTLLEKESDVLARFRAMPNVRWAQRNHRVEYRNDECVGGGIPNDPLFEEQWNMERVNMLKVWEQFGGNGQTILGDTIVVAVIDGGCDLDHEDLLPRIWRNNLEIPDDSMDNDQNGYTDDYFGWRVVSHNDNHTTSGHGTLVAGIIGATGNNERGVTGINQHIKIMIISGAGFESEVVEAFDYLIAARQKYNQTNGSEGAFVVAVNISFGWNNAQPEEYPLLCAGLDDLGAVGIIPVAATANNAVDVDVVGDVPTGCLSPYMIAVTATTTADGRRTSAAYGAQSVDIGAPGEHITSTYSNNTYDEGNGTSFATPHVAGAVALLYSLPSNTLANEAKTSPELAATHVKQAILTGAEPIFALKNITTTGGRLDVWRAAGALRNSHGMPFAEFSHADSSAAAAYLEAAIFTGNSINVQIGTNGYQPITLRLCDLLGRTLFTYTTTTADYFSDSINIPIPTFPTGIYVAYLQNGKKIASKKVAVFR